MKLHFLDKSDLYQWRRVAVITGVILSVAAVSASAQNAPTVTTGKRKLQVGTAECQRRAATAFGAEGYRLNGSGADWAYGRLGPFQVGVSCIDGGSGDTWAALYVAGNGVTVATVSDVRDRLLRRIEFPTSASSTVTPATRPVTPRRATQTLCGWTVSTAVYDKWRQLGGESGPLGCAISEEQQAAPSITGASATIVMFKGEAAIYHITSGRYLGQVHAVHGRIAQKYTEVGHSESWLGYPISDEVTEANGVRVRFEGGSLVWNRAAGRVAAFRNTR